ATIAINVVGHGGGGTTGTLTIIPLVGAPVTIPDGGRGIDQDGNGTIQSTEGSSAVGANAIVGNRDGLRQTVADLMQLVRVLQVGVDIDGNGAADLNAGRIYYFGQSFGGIYGTKFIALEPDVRAGVPVAYAPHLRKIPLDGVATRPFISQNAKGDQTVPNPTSSAIVRAGDAHDRWTLFRNDLVRQARPTAPANPHTFLTNIGNPVVADLAIAAQ